MRQSWESGSLSQVDMNQTESELGVWFSIPSKYEPMRDKVGSLGLNLLYLVIYTKSIHFADRIKRLFYELF